jgi:AraC-like DNA-binding protein
MVTARPMVAAMPELRWAGRHESRRASTWRPHFHDDLLEVHYLESGMIPCCVGDRVVQVSGGQVLVALPNEVHGGRWGVMGPCRIFWLAMVFGGDDPTLLGLTPFESLALVAALRSATQRVFPASSELVGAFRRLTDLLPECADALTVVRIRADLLAILTEVARAGAGGGGHHSVLVEEAIRMIDEHLATPVTIAALSRRLGWSRQHLQQAFREQVGASPWEYCLYKRIAEACRLLGTTTCSVTDVAHGLGFGSSQYFGTAFKRLMGTTPGGFRKILTLPATREPHRHALPYSPS